MVAKLPPPIQRRVNIFEAVAKNLVDTAKAHPNQPAVGELLLEAAGTIEESIRLIKLANWAARLNFETAAAMAAARKAR